MTQQTISPSRTIKTRSDGLKLPLGMQHFGSFDEMDQDRIGQLEQMAFEYGRYFDSYLITEPEREYLWASDDHGVLSYLRRGRYLHVAGGLICEEYFRSEFLAEIIEFVRLNNLVISFFSIEEEDAQLYRKHKFQVSPFGVDSRIRLKGHHWRGKEYQWVRRQVNYIRRQDVVFEEWDEMSVDSETWEQRLLELKAVSDEHIAGKSQDGEIPFFEGRLISNHIFRRRIFVARSDHGNGRVEGFLLCNPMNDGRNWAIEMYRQRDDAPRGTIPFLIKQAIDVFQVENCEEVSICPVPTIGCERKIPGSSTKVRYALLLWKKFGASLFDCRGLYHFKSRFRPEFVDIYVCAYPCSGWGSIWAYINSIKTFNLKWVKFLKKLFSRKVQRRTLVKIS